MNKFYTIILISLIFINIRVMNSYDSAKGENLLKQIHSQLTLLHGFLHEEYDEQLMEALFIEPNDKVLEIGGNLGRNSCVIAKILNNSKDLVVVETDPQSVKLLIENRNHNKLEFNVENSAISRVPLIQSGWHTIPSNVILPGYYKINTITYPVLKQKYKVKFNTLVADCEGALYYILRDEPTMIKDFKKVIVENDYTDINHFKYVQSLLLSNGFKLAYSKPLAWHPLLDWDKLPCNPFFFQVYLKQ